MKELIFLVLVMFARISFCQSIGSKVSFSNNDFSIEYPATWKLDTSNTFTKDFFLYSPLENESDKFSENINLVIQDLANMNQGIRI